LLLGRLQDQRENDLFGIYMDEETSISNDLDIGGGEREREREREFIDNQEVTESWPVDS
jgi:hypothetical protein